MSGANEHIQRAEEALHFSETRGVDSTERQIRTSKAQAEAALALAYEQRTANLIALFGDGGTDEAHVELLNTITERLGLA